MRALATAASFDVATNLLEQGEVDRESLYSAQLQVAKARQQCVSARAKVNTATAELNLAMGRNTACPTTVRNIAAEPTFDMPLISCLRTAVGNRREVRVVSDWVAKACEAEIGRAVAHGRQVCDRIAYEVNCAYQHVEDARQRIQLARSAVRLAAERLRIVMDKYIEGEASPTDVVDAQTEMTVAEEQYQATIYELRSAMARTACHIESNRE